MGQKGMRVFADGVSGQATGKADQHVVHPHRVQAVISILKLVAAEFLSTRLQKLTVEQQPVNLLLQAFRVRLVQLVEEEK